MSPAELSAKRISWFTISETNGKILAATGSQLGNVGMPSTIDGISSVRPYFVLVE
jgi:hypothetical protein